VLFLHVTTRIKDRKDEMLFGQKGGTGFPTFMFMDPKGGVLAKQPGVLDIERMTGLHDKAKERRAAFVELQKKAAAGDEKAKMKLAVWELELTHTTIEQFRKAYPDLSKLDDDSRETVLGLWADAVMQNAFAEFQKIVGQDRSKTAEGAKVAAPIVFAAAKEGAKPSSPRARMSWFWLLGTGGEALENVEMLKLAVDGLEDAAESNARLGDMVEGWSKKLKQLQGGGADEAVEEEEPEEIEEEG